MEMTFRIEDASASEAADFLKAMGESAKVPSAVRTVERLCDMPVVEFIFGGKAAPQPAPAAKDCCAEATPCPITDYEIRPPGGVGGVFPGKEVATDGAAKPCPEKSRFAFGDKVCHVTSPDVQFVVIGHVTLPQEGLGGIPRPACVVRRVGQAADLFPVVQTRALFEAELLPAGKAD